MKRIEETRQIDRYIALDIHKEYVLAGGMNAEQVWVLSPRRISMAKFREWAGANLQEGDAVVLETTTNV
jgi:transposase